VSPQAGGGPECMQSAKPQRQQALPQGQGQQVQEAV
jgi:hypothetical protein